MNLNHFLGGTHKMDGEHNFFKINRLDANKNTLFFLVIFGGCRYIGSQKGGGGCKHITPEVLLGEGEQI